MLINGNLILGSTISRRNTLRATITYNLTNCTATNVVATVASGAYYTTKLVANTAFSYCAAKITMGLDDITLDCYNPETGIISIERVTGNVVITAEKLTTFANASWYAIKNVAQNNFATTIGWAIGDTKPLTIGTYTYTARICDLTEGRYQYAENDEIYSNMVIEVVELYENIAPKSANNSQSNYDYNTVRSYYTDTIMPLMDPDLVPLLELIKLPTYYYNQTTNFSNNKLFMPGVTELGFGEYEQTTIFEYYDLMGTVTRIKQRINNPSVNIEWWTRTGSWAENAYSGNYFHGAVGVNISTSGSSSTILYRSWSNSSNTTPADAMTNSKGIPIFWAW